MAATVPCAPPNSASISTCRSTTSFSLEAELGASLLARNTRHTVLTDCGERFLHEARLLLDQAQRATATVQPSPAQLAGRLHITSTSAFALQAVLPVLADMAEAHPGLAIEHVASSHLCDLVAERFDVAIRLGELPDSDYKAARIGDYALQLVASPGYLLQHPVGSAEALAQVDWLAHSHLSNAPWRFFNAPATPEISRFERPSRLQADSAEALLAMALRGLGVALLPGWLVADTLAKGELVSVIDPGHFARQPIHALYRNSMYVPATIRVFIDQLTQQWATQQSPY
ncbi:LysR substrate-binding domain-containing protein [Pseudomonas sp. NPDC090592]|uniref:substrate binding domain-containing protein n=1 Tax=Pseudomonas sp. NPDC090592 TaxID=3364480 RepID=UPI00383B4C32